MHSEIKEALEGFTRAIHEERAAREAFEKRSQSEKLELEAKLDANFAKADAAVKEAQEASAKAARFAIAGSASPASSPKADHTTAFWNWMRSPRDQKTIAALQDAERKSVFTTGTGGSAAGGYAVPEEIDRAIITQVTNLSPMRQVCRVATASTPDFKILVDTLGTSTAWVGEKDSRAETNTPQLGEVAPTFGTLMAYPKATEESLNDIFFDVAGWLSSSVATAFAAEEGAAFTTGNGSNKPTGLMSATKASNDDSSLTFGQLQYIPSGAAAGFPVLSVTSPYSYPADALITTVYKLKADYRANARWMMNKATAATVRKFKDADGNYLWQPSLVLGQPATLLGYPVIENEAMADITTNSYPIAFGDFRRGYTIVDLVGLRVTLDEVTAPGYVKWYFRRRVGGKLTDNQAVKVIKCAIS